MTTLLRKKDKELNLFMDITSLINSTRDSGRVKMKAVEAATELLDAEACSLLLVDSITGEICFETAVGEISDKLKSVRLDKGQGIVGWVAEYGESVVTNNVVSDKRFFEGVDESSGFNTRHLISVPVKFKDKLVGVLQAVNKNNGTFGYDDEEILNTLANQLAITMENDELYKNAITDNLTGLYHQKYFKSRLEEETGRARKHKHALNVVLIDIDFFKNVNDRHGHLAGDRVLEGVAEILKNNTSSSDISARYGGEEFALILPHISHKNAIDVCERLRKAVETTNFNGVEITVSIGLGHFDRKCSGSNPAELIEITDRALYRAKDRGRNRIETVAPNVVA